MNWDLIKIATLVLAYIIGSVPTSVWFGKIFYKIDLREHGSGNAGATNALRVFGKRAGAFVLLFDAFKGFAAVSLGFYFLGTFTLDNYMIVYQLMLGTMALIGHVFPVFAQFKGGKGVATLTGIVVALFPLVMLICLGVFLLFFIPTRYVSLGSMAAGIAFPLVLLLIEPEPLISQVSFSLAVALFVPYTHRQNIRRLLKGKESKIYFQKKPLADSPNRDQLS